MKYKTVILVPTACEALAFAGEFPCRVIPADDLYGTENLNRADGGADMVTGISEDAGGGCVPPVGENVIPVIICGVGMAGAASAAAWVVREYSPRLVMLAGIAGAYPDSGIAVGECVVVDSERVADQGAFRGGVFMPLYVREYGCPRAASVRSLRRVAGCTVNAGGSQFADCDGNKDPSLQEKFRRGKVENMEGAAFFAVCTALGVDFLEVRAVSNLTTDPRGGWRMEEAVRSLASGVKKVLDETEDQHIAVS